MRPVAVIGCGGLGVPAAWTLALAGRTALRLIDRDAVELSNLHRQVLYDAADVGRPKAEALAARLQARFADLTVEVRTGPADEVSLPSLLEGCDAVVEATDDAETKFAVSDWASAPDSGRFAVIAAAIGRRGQWMVVEPGGACYRCLFEAPPPAEQLGSCAVAGVLGPLTGEVGSLAARSLLAALAGRPDAARSALVRRSPRGLLRTPVARMAECGCGRGGS